MFWFGGVLIRHPLLQVTVLCVSTELLGDGSVFIVVKLFALAVSVCVNIDRYCVADTNFVAKVWIWQSHKEYHE